MWVCNVACTVNCFVFDSFYVLPEKQIDCKENIVAMVGEDYFIFLSDCENELPKSAFSQATRLIDNIGVQQHPVLHSWDFIKIKTNSLYIQYI